MDFQSYLRWLDDEEVGSPFYILSTTNIDVRDRDEWNSKGREIYYRQKLEEHAAWVAKVLDRLALADFFAQHEYRPCLWFPQEIQAADQAQEKANQARAWLKGIEPHSFDGGFAISDQISDFLSVFIDYPFLLRYSNIDILSLQKPLILKITHHLTVDFVANAPGLVDEIERDCNTIGLHCVRGVT